MATIVQIANPFKPTAEARRWYRVEGQTIREWFSGEFGDAKHFKTPHLTLLNGKLIWAADWETYVIQPEDVIGFSPIPGDPIDIVLVIIAVVAAVAAVLMMPDPQIPGDNGSQGNPVYNLNGQTNRIRLGEPVERVFGRCRIWPSYAAPPFNLYEDNNQYQMSLFCLGVGTFEIGQIYIEDTPIENFDGVTYEIIQPGGSVSIFPDAVITSVEVAGIELYGPNQPEYPAGGGWAGPFVVNAAGTKITRVEVDAIFPQGLYQLSDGLKAQVTVQVEVEVREIDDDGDPMPGADWVRIVDTDIVRKSNTPQRVTLGDTVTEGRYECRMRRSTNKNGSTSVISTVQWEALRGMSFENIIYNDVTMLAVKALATNSLNNNSRSRVNLYVTAKNAVYDPFSETWSAPVATRNPVWAFCEIYRGQDGARLEDQYLDLVTLAELAAVLEEREDWFDWTLDQPGTVWPAGQMALRVARTAPIPQGSFLTAIRDIPQANPSALFGPYNTVKGTIRETITFPKFLPYNAVEIEYTDPDTWKPATVLCVLPGSTGDNPEQVKLPGCSDRQRAYREGMFMAACRRYRLSVVKFRTGLEGILPTYMDQIGVTNETLQPGQAGAVLAYDTVTNTATLSTVVTFPPPDLQAVVVFRNATGGPSSEPIACTAVPGHPNKIVLESDPPGGFTFNPNTNPPAFFFGAADLWTFKGKVVSLEPQENGEVEVVCLNDAPEVYTFDEYEAPPAPTTTTPRDPEAEEPENVVISPVPTREDMIVVGWRRKPGALWYYPEVSYDDGATWEELPRTKQTSVEIPITAGAIKVRVSAEGPSGRRGQPSVATTQTVGIAASVPAAPTLLELSSAFTGTHADFRWQPAAAAIGYTVTIYRTGDMSVARTFQQPGTTFSYTNAMAVADGTVTPNLTIGLKSYNTAGPSTPEITLDVSNPAPGVLTGISSIFNSEDASNRKYTASWTASGAADFYRYRLYGSLTPGFTADGSTQLYEGTTASYLILNPRDGIDGHTEDYYWRVRAVDVWGNLGTLSAEQTIAGAP